VTWLLDTNTLVLSTFRSGDARGAAEIAIPSNWPRNARVLWC